MSGMPPGVPYIVGNEAAERFSFYGMRAILVVFMTQYLMNASGSLDVMTEPQAKYWFHTFNAGVYFLPVFGALLSDGVLGKYRTVISLSIVYCFGHAALAVDDTRSGLAIGLCLIAIGSGGIKPCVSANVGDQFGAQNQHLLEKVFAWFYFSVNFGALFSQVLTPRLLTSYGPRWAFGVPGIMMALATLVFWLGRNKFVHVRPGGLGFLREAFSAEGLKTLGKLAVIYTFVAMFWSLFDQTASAWVLQAQHMDRMIFGYTVEASQVQAVNSVMVLTFIPIFSYGIYPLINRVFPLTPLRKISIGFFLTAAAFAISAVIENWIAAGQTPHIVWQLLAYAVMTSAEVMVSITGLEFSYSQAPKKMKSVVMALWLLSVSAGNLFTALVNKFIQDEHGQQTLTGPAYFWLFTGLMAGTAVVFVFVAMTYRGRTYIQNEAPAETA